MALLCEPKPRRQGRRPERLQMGRFLRFLRAVKTAVPPFLETFNTVMAAIEHVAFRLAILGLTMYGLYHALAP